MATREEALQAFSAWFGRLPVYKESRGPAKGTIAAGLVVLERLKTEFDLSLQSHRAKRGSSQIKGASGKAISRILAEFNETRPFLSEGGRTNRGAPGDIGSMLEAIGRLGLQSLSSDKRNAVIVELQQFLVGKIREYHNRERLTFVFSPSDSTRNTIRQLLVSARNTGKEGCVAEYLVGAKLALRYPEAAPENKSCSAADQQVHRAGDFRIGDTVFHVTVAPTPAVYEKCMRNLDEGLRVYLLVPQRKVDRAAVDAKERVAGKIPIESIESFVSQNVEELGGFAKDKVPMRLRELLDLYNKRVNEVENDKSMLIKIPPNL